jgi:hypothetical protein
VEQTLAHKQKEQKFTKTKRSRRACCIALFQEEVLVTPHPPPECGVHLQVAPLEAREVCSMPEALLFFFSSMRRSAVKNKNCSMREVLFKKDSLQHAGVAPPPFFFCRSPKCFGRKGWGSWWGRYKFSKVKALWIYILYIYTNSQKSKLYSAWEYRH